MSHINGQGFGSGHDWRRGDTTQSPIQVPYGSNSTVYECNDCGEAFRHYYHDTPNIFDAIQKSGVPEHCAKKKEAA